ncbi:MAG: hypothetical protein WC291_04595 [Thermodesulfovibrionales bacterium]|jgi:hypothetical protein
MSTWEVKLRGDVNLLSRLAEEMQRQDLAVICNDGEYFLRSKYFSSQTDKGELFERANQVIQFLNGSLDIVSNRIEAIKSDGFWLVHDDGRREEESFGFLSLIMPLSALSLAESRCSTPPYDWFELWQTQENVKYVFHLLGSGKLDWFSLFNIYETVRDDPQYSSTDKWKRVETIKSWISEQQNTLFFETANWYRHSDYGKYYDKKCKEEKPNSPPDEEMSLSEGNSFIRQLVNEWLTWKSSYCET